MSTHRRPPTASPTSLVDTLVDMLRLMLKTRRRPAPRLVGIGLAVPGVVTDSAGLVRFAPNLAGATSP